MRQINILGCGWLGFPLAVSLLEEGYCVKGSVTHENKLTLLSEKGIIPYLLQVENNQIVGNMSEFISGADYLILTIPPGTRKGETSFDLKIKTILKAVGKTPILFMSSIAVYGQHQGTVNEQNEPLPDTANGQLLHVCETLVLQHNPNNVVLRFGGLLGDDRHPITHLAGKKAIENPTLPINLIHKTDCIGILKKIIHTPEAKGIYNAVTPFHPTRQDYYTREAEKRGLPIPLFNPENTGIGKTVTSVRIESELQYRYKLSSL